MKHDDGWGRLIAVLDAWTSASEIEPGRIEVSLPASGASRQVVVVMTPRQWDDLADNLGFEDAVWLVKQTLLGLRPGERFAVYSYCELEPSTEPALPESTDFTPEPGGEWVTYDREGGIESRFAHWSEPDELR